MRLGRRKMPCQVLIVRMPPILVIDFANWRRQTTHKQGEWI